MSKVRKLKPGKLVQRSGPMDDLRDILGKRIVKIHEVRHSEYTVEADSNMGLGMVDNKLILTTEDGIEVRL
jgi:hypothetical protein